MADELVKVNLTIKRMYRARQEDREAITVGPGEVEVPAWVAESWGFAPAVRQPETKKSKTQGKKADGATS